MVCMSEPHKSSFSANPFLITHIETQPQPPKFLVQCARLLRYEARTKSTSQASQSSTLFVFMASQTSQPQASFCHMLLVDKVVPTFAAEAANTFMVKVPTIITTTTQALLCLLFLHYNVNDLDWISNKNKVKINKPPDHIKIHASAQNTIVALQDRFHTTNDF